MENNSDLMDIKHGKFTNWKRKGKLSELDRLKKRQKELHIMKLSQEWDARRHKRKMDRIQWLQQRKSDQSSTQNEDSETSKEDEGPSQKKSANSSLHTNFKTSPVSGYSSHENIYERDNREQLKPMSMSDGDREDENASNPCEDSICSSSGDDKRSPANSPLNQVYKSVVVKTERADPERFSNSNYMSMSRQLNFKNTTHTSAESKKRRKKESYAVRRRHTVEEHLEFTPQMNEGKRGSNAYESLVNLVNSQPSVQESCTQQSSVIAQAMKQSGLDDEDVPDEDVDDEEPSLLMASEPVRFEDVLQRGGTNIQRLPTRSVDIMSNRTPPSNQRDTTTEKMTHSRPHSRDSAIEESHRIRRDEGTTNKPYPQIKQCYSLMGQDSRSPLPSPSSTHTGSPVSTMASTSPEGNTVTTEGRHHPVAHATSTGSQSCPPSGYLVPVYKPSADEVVYAFVPNSSDRVIPGHPRPPEVVKTTGCTNAAYVPVDDRYSSRTGYPAIRPPTAVIHHGRGVHSPLERAEYPHKLAEPQPTNVTWVNVQSTAVREKQDYQPKALHVVPTTNLRRENPHSPPGNLHSGQHREPDMVTKPRHSPSPVVTMVNGYSSVQNPAHLNDTAVPNGPGIRSSPHGNPGVDTINNPTAIYVRPRLVPREIVVPYHAGSGNVPIVEYIKTDVICDKDLVYWTAQNVAEFISATDCSDSAKIFIEEDIDGKAVLLLSQDVFVNRLNLKLGTAVKLYNHVANLRSALLM